MSEAMSEASEAGVEQVPAADRGAAQVEDNGRWFAVAMTLLTILFVAGTAAVVHSLVATFK